MLQFLNQCKEELKENTFISYSFIGKELIIFGNCYTKWNAFMASRVWEDAKRVHIFLVDSVIQELQEFASFLECITEKVVYIYSSFEKVKNQIEKVYQNDSYLFYMNLWDSIDFDELKRPVEYSFQQYAEGRASLEFEIPKQERVFLCSDVKALKDNTVLYSEIYCNISNAADYEELKLYENRMLMAKEKIYLSGLNESLQEIARESGYQIV